MRHKSTIQKKKFNNLLKDKKPLHDPEKLFLIILVMFIKCERYALPNGLNFRIPSKKLNHADYLVNFGLFYRDICNLEVLSAKYLDFMRTKIKDIALSLFRTYSNNVP